MTRLLPVSLIIAALTYVALRPPEYLADYKQALKVAAAGDLNSALEYLSDSIEANPSFSAARFQRGRTRIALGEIDLAMNDFGHIARTERDAKSMAYLGYCFNLKQVSVAAIPWYERVIGQGIVSMPVLNNLGASYLAAQTHLSKSEQMKRAEHYLLMAWRLDNSSITVQLNLLRLAVAKSKFDPLYDPLEVWPKIQTLLAPLSADPQIQSHIEAWCHAVEEYEIAQRGPVTDRTMEGPARAAFRQWRQKTIPPQRPMPAAGDSSRHVAELKSSRTNLYFLEPLWLNNRQP